MFGEGFCGSHILRSHILRSGLCSGLLVPGTSLRVANLQDEAVTITKHEDGRRRLEDDIDIVVKDIVATNGVLHIIDSLMVPASARPLAVVVKQRLGGFLERAGGSAEAVNSLVEKLGNLRNVSLFLPAEAALGQLPRDLLAEVKKDEKRLEELIMHHVLPEARGAHEFK